jgi:hypothetical protein
MEVIKCKISRALFHFLLPVIVDVRHHKEGYVIDHHHHVSAVIV